MPPDQDTLTASRDDIEAVTRAAMDYIHGFTEADPERHRQAYHPECVKRRYIADEESGIEELKVFSPQVMVDHAAASSRIEDCEAEVIIDAISADIASVRIYSCLWVDFLHVVKARGQWKLFHVTWHRKDGET